MTQLSLLDITSRYPHSPGSKTGGASAKAAEAMKSRAPSLKARAFALIDAAPEGMTADECAEALGCSASGMRPRLSELYAEGKVVKSARVRRNASGLDAHVYMRIGYR